MTAVEASSFPSVFKEVRYADIYTEATRLFPNHPVCANKERDLLLMAQPPLLENGGEWVRLATKPFPSSANFKSRK